jgi:hypothetical protein
MSTNTLSPEDLYVRMSSLRDRLHDQAPADAETVAEAMRVIGAFAAAIASEGDGVIVVEVTVTDADADAAEDPACGSTQH